MNICAVVSSFYKALANQRPHQPGGEFRQEPADREDLQQAQPSRNQQLTRLCSLIYFICLLIDF